MEKNPRLGTASAHTYYYCLGCVSLKRGLPFTITPFKFSHNASAANYYLPNDPKSLVRTVCHTKVFDVVYVRY